MPAYRCRDPRCAARVAIDWDRRTKTVTVALSRERSGFPTHGSCELAKSIDEIDRNKLQEVR